MKSTTGSPSYLIRNDYSYYFRIRVPTDMQRYVGRKELSYSLKTGYVGIAKHKARLLASLVQQLFRNFKNGDRRLSELSEDKIQELIIQYIKKSLEEFDRRPYADNGSDECHPLYVTKEEFNNYINMLDDIREEMNANMNLSYFSMFDDIVNELLKESGIDNVDTNSVVYKKLCIEMHKVGMKLIPLEKKHLLGDYSYKQELPDIFPEACPRVASITQLLKADSTQVSAKLLSEVIEIFWDENERAGNWGERTKNEYQTCKHLLLRIAMGLYSSLIIYAFA